MNHSDIIFCGYTVFDQQIVVNCLLFVDWSYCSQLHKGRYIVVPLILNLHIIVQLCDAMTMFSPTLLTYKKNLDYF